jgi:hypothetical protein
MRAIVILTLTLSACHCGEVSSEEDARRAYLGIDPGVERALRLGFQGYNTASSANISPQTESGDVSGQMTIGGQVDQGTSANKGMRLTMELADYSDPPTQLDQDDEDYEIRYATKEGAPANLTLSLKNIPNGTLTGTLMGTVVMSSDLEGDLALNLNFSGEIEEIPGEPGKTQRKAGTTHVTGTAVSEAGTYNVDLFR